MSESNLQDVSSLARLEYLSQVLLDNPLAPNKGPDLNFWLQSYQPPKRLSSEEIIEKLCETPKFKECYDKIMHCYVLWSYPNIMVGMGKTNSDRDIEEFDYGKNIWKMYEDIDYLENEYSNLATTCVVYPPIRYMQEFYKLADDICKKYDPIYSSELCMNDSEIVNGYKLYNIKKKPFMNRNDYEDCIILWQSNKEYTQEQFMELYENTACADWAKQTDHGESFGGYWAYPDGSPEKLDAWNLTRTTNGVALWNLPYPKEFVLKTIEMGCCNRMECVRYSNFLCEWIKRKSEQMNK